MAMETCPCFDETVDPCPRCGATVAGNDAVRGVCQADFMDKALGDEIERLRAALERVTNSAELLARETSDPGTEALAAIHCAREELRRSKSH